MVSAVIIDLLSRCPLARHWRNVNRVGFPLICETSGAIALDLIPYLSPERLLELLSSWVWTGVDIFKRVSRSMASIIDPHRFLCLAIPPATQRVGVNKSKMGSGSSWRAVKINDDAYGFLSFST